LFARYFAHPLPCSRHDFAKHRRVTAPLVVETVPVRRRGLERSAHSFGPAFNDAPKHSEGVSRAVGVKQESDCSGLSGALAS
jgi:hypothetical protein